MAIFGSAGGQQSIVLQGVSNPNIANVTLLLANTEYSIVLPSDTQRYLIKLRDPTVEFKLRFVSGSDWITVPRGCNFSEDGLSTSSLTLYVEALSANQVVELVSWS